MSTTYEGKVLTQKKATQVQMESPSDFKRFDTRNFMQQHGLGAPIRIDWCISGMPFNEE